jgi:hypothetical protein
MAGVPGNLVNVTECGTQCKAEWLKFLYRAHGCVAYPISINFAEAASIGCSPMKEHGVNPSERVMVPSQARC